MKSQIIIEMELAGDGNDSSPVDPDTVFSAALNLLKDGLELDDDPNRKAVSDDLLQTIEDSLVGLARMEALKDPHLVLELVEKRLEASNVLITRAEIQHIETKDPRYLPGDEVADAPLPGSG